MWISGKPGSGKSVLSKGIQVELESQYRSMGGSLVAHWSYSQRGNEDFQRHDSMLRSILHTLFDQDGRLFKCAEDIYRRERRIKRHKWAEIQGVLMELFESLSAFTEAPTMLLLVDGMDESENGLEGSSRRRDILLLMKRVAECDNSRVRIILSSRPIPEIEVKFKFCNHIIVERENQCDIEQLVSSRLISLRKTWQATFATCEGDKSSPTLHIDRRFGRAKGHLLEASVQRDLLPAKEEEELMRIKTYLSQKAQGVILWANLVARELERLLEDEGFSLYELRMKLAAAPSELQAYYRYILPTIPKLWKLDGSPNLSGIGMAQKLLHWTIGAGSKGRVLLRDLLEALAIPEDDSEIRDMLSCDEDPLLLRMMVIRNDWNYFRRQLYAYCGPFIEVIPPANMAVSDRDADIYHDTKGHWAVQLLHQSCRDFLGNQQSAGPLHVVVEAAEANVESSTERYLKVVLPTSRTLYAPSTKPFWRNVNVKIVAVVTYLQHHPLLEFIFSVVCAAHLPSSNYIQSLFHGSSVAWVLSCLVDPSTSSEGCPEKHIEVACALGFEDAVRILLASLFINIQAWHTIKYPTLQRLLSTAMTCGLESVVRDISSLYLSNITKPSLLSILPLVEQAAGLGHSSVINALFRSLLGTFETISNIWLLEMERQSWLCEAKKAKGVRTEFDLKPTFPVVAVLCDSSQEIEKLAVERCMRLVLHFADEKLVSDNELQPLFDGPILEWDHFNEVYRFTKDPNELPDTKIGDVANTEVSEPITDQCSKTSLLKNTLLEEQLRFGQSLSSISIRSWSSCSDLTSGSCTALYMKEFPKTWRTNDIHDGTNIQSLFHTQEHTSQDHQARRYHIDTWIRDRLIDSALEKLQWRQAFESQYGTAPGEIDVLRDEHWYSDGTSSATPFSSSLLTLSVK